MGEGLSGGDHRALSIVCRGLVVSLKRREFHRLQVDAVGRLGQKLAVDLRLPGGFLPVGIAVERFPVGVCLFAAGVMDEID